MARIPMGNFGMRQAELVKTRVAAPNGADLQAVQGLAQTVQGLAGQQMAQDRQKQDEADRIAAMLAESKAANQKDAINAEASKRIEIGEDPTEVKKAWTSQYDKIDETEFGGVAEKYKGTLGAQSVRQKGVGLMALDSAHGEFQKKQLIGNLDALGGETLTAATRDPIGAIDRYSAALDVAGDALNEKQKSDLKQKFTKDAWITNVNQRVMTGDESSLSGMKDELAKDDGEFSALDSTTRLALQGHVNSKLAHMKSMTQAQENAILAGASQNIAATIDNMRSGVLIPPKDLAIAVEQAEAMKDKNPTLSIQLSAAIRNQDVWSELNTAPLQSQQQLSETMLSDAKKGSGKGQVYDQALMQQAEIAQRQVSQNFAHFRADPYGYVESKTGKPAPVIDLGLMMSGRPEDRDMLMSQIKARTEYAQIGTQVVGHSPGLLTTRESENIAAAFEKSGEAEQKGIITALSGMSQSDAMVNKTLAEIGKRSPVLAQVVAYDRGGVVTESGVKVSDLVLRGSRAVAQNKDMKIAAPDRDLFIKEFEKQASGDAMFSGMDGFRGSVLEAAESAYYGIKARAGDYSKDYKSEAAKDAIRGAMGNPVKFNSAAVVPPPGMQAAEFKAQAKASLSSMWVDLKKAGAVNLPSQSDFMDDSTLQIQSDGRYRILHSNGGPFYAEFKDGKSPVVMSVGRSSVKGKIK